MQHYDEWYNTKSTRGLARTERLGSENDLDKKQ